MQRFQYRLVEPRQRILRGDTRADGAKQTERDETDSETETDSAGCLTSQIVSPSVPALSELPRRGCGVAP